MTETSGSPNYAEIDGLRLHYVEAGSGPLVLLLHGFPEYWYGWRHQLPALAASGYRAVAVDLRGYNLSDKPEGVAAYRLDRLAADIVGLVRFFGCAKASIVGHDWGGVIAWVTAMRHPEVVERLIVLNAPHPAIYRREALRWRQMWKSWYILAAQLPWLPEALIRFNGFAGLLQTLRTEPARPGAFPEDDLDRYRAALVRPGALKAALNYYRALVRYFRTWQKPSPIVRAPTLVIWGERDRYCATSCLRGLDQWVPGVHIERLPRATHWVQHDAPEPVNRLILAFLGQVRSE